MGTRVIIASDADLRGEISIGSGTVIHPKATILALQGPISIGANCIVEELAVIVNRTSQAIKIGDSNLFQVGCRIEAMTVGSNNVFEARCKVACNVGIADSCTIGAGCSVFPQPISAQELADLFTDGQDQDKDEQPVEASEPNKADPAPVQENLPDRTVVYGSNNKRRLWSGEGAGQLAALHAKHLDYLRDAIPSAHKLKIVQGTRSDLT